MAEQNIRFRSDIAAKVNECGCCGDDETIARAAWVIPPADPDAYDEIKDVKERYGKDATPVGITRLIAACLRGRHNSPFEEGFLSVYVEAPGIVWWQLTRQRFMSLNSEDFSFSLESGRYKELDPEFYTPPLERPCREPIDFRPMRPTLAVDFGLKESLCASLRNMAHASWLEYRALIEAGVVRELARLVLPNWALYCDGYVSGRPLTWLQFFSKRRSTTDTAVATYPMYEIEEFCRQCELIFAERWPLTYRAFLDAGRVAP